MSQSSKQVVPLYQSPTDLFQDALRIPHETELEETQIRPRNLPPRRQERTARAKQ